MTERPERTAQGYRRFRCRDCGKQFNERSAGVLNRTQYPSDVIALVVLWRLRYRLTLRDLAEMFLIRGIVFSYEAVREWEAKLTPILSDELRQRRRRGRLAPSWYVDAVAQLVREGPTFSEHGVVRWRRVDLSRVIEARFGVQLAERSVGALLRRLGFRRLSARPRHPGHDAAAQETHKKTSPIWSPPRSRSTRAASRSSFGGRMKPVSASKAR
jgi:transposase